MRQTRSLDSIRAVAAAVVVCLSLGTIPLPGQARMISTEQAVSQVDQRERLQQLLSRDDVAQQLAAYGVDPADARDRVAALTDEQVASLAGKVDSLPAGGVDALGVILIVGLVFVVTDLIGYTSVYPFLRSR